MGKSRTSVLLGLVFLCGLAGLYVADRMLRRMERMDEAVVQGHTGLSSLDEFLARQATARKKEAAHDVALATFQQAIGAETNLQKRIAASYELVRFESSHGHSGSKVAEAALWGIVREGKALPQTLEAWRGLTSAAGSSPGDTASMKALLPGYLAATQNLPNNAAKLADLYSIWRFSEQHRAPDIALAALETIHAGFPREPDALEAYEALAQKYRWKNETNRLAAVEQSSRDARALLIQRPPPKTQQKRK